MAITVEPGVYLPRMLAEKYGLAEEFHDVGIRIEDDVIIQGANQSPRVLTDGVPKEVDDIELLMKYK